MVYVQIILSTLFMGYAMAADCSSTPAAMDPFNGADLAGTWKVISRCEKIVPEARCDTRTFNASMDGVQYEYRTQNGVTTLSGTLSPNSSPTVGYFDLTYEGNTLLYKIVSADYPKCVIAYSCLNIPQGTDEDCYEYFTQLDPVADYLDIKASCYDQANAKSLTPVVVDMDHTNCNINPTDKLNQLKQKLNMGSGINFDFMSKIKNKMGSIIPMNGSLGMLNLFRRADSMDGSSRRHRRSDDEDHLEAPMYDGIVEKDDINN